MWGKNILPLEIMRKCIEQIASYILKLPSMLNYDQVERMIDYLIQAYKSDRSVFVVGAGRSGLVARAFAMRLMHLGFHVYVIGETITPAAREGDILVAISGSGRTAIVVTTAQVAKQVKAKIIAVTSHPDSPLGELADHIVFVPGRTKISEETDYFSRQILGIHEPLAPLGTLFEISAMVFLESIITELMKRLGMTEEDLRSRHAQFT